jgi:5-oxopent-3-ene-1,2,5-tricarboxylate decarboxylase/2-hydroxyhepta-2,4-diene-1,7-dioate isomerase
MNNHAVVETLRPRRTPVTDEQLAIIRTLPLEAVYTAVVEHGHTNCYHCGFKSTRPSERMAGRAVTLRFLPKRPDLDEAMAALARQDGFAQAFYVRAAEEAKPGDVLVVDAGGDVHTGGFFGDVTALGASLAGAKGVVIYGSTRDYAELAQMEGFPVLAQGFDPIGSTQSGVDWNVPVRIGNATVLPGDVVLADSYAAIFFPPEIAGTVIARAKEIDAEEAYCRELVRRGDRPFREIYPMSEGLRKEYRDQCR